MDADVHDDDLIEFEADPLLADEQRDGRGDGQPIEPPEPHHHQAQKPARLCFLSRLQAKKPSTIVGLLTLLMFSFTLSGLLYLIPMFRLLEDAICHQHYKKDLSEPIDEMLCKVEEVQSYLAYLGGWSSLVNSIVGVIAALPYGVMADRIGRKPTFILAYSSIAFAFIWGPMLLAFGIFPNLALVIFGSLFFLIGGGVPVALNCLNAMASDVTTENDRSSGLLYISSGAMLGGLVGPVLGGLLMEATGPWVPVCLVFATVPFVFLLLLFIPETLPTKLRQTATTQHQPLTKQLRTATKDLTESLALLRNPNIALALVPFTVQPVLFAAYSSTLAQHISTYFGWTLAQTNYLLSPLGLLQLLVLLLVPQLTRALTRPSGLNCLCLPFRLRLSPFAADLHLARASLLFLLAGALTEALSAAIGPFLLGLAVGGLGAAHGALCRAVASAHVGTRQTSRLYALISVADTGGAALGGPVLAWLFGLGLAGRGTWRRGLPWFYIAGLLAVAAVALTGVRRPRVKLGEGQGEEDGGEDGEGGGERDGSGLGYQSAEEEEEEV